MVGWRRGDIHPGLKEGGIVEDDNGKRLTLVSFDNGDLFVPVGEVPRDGWFGIVYGDLAGARPRNGKMREYFCAELGYRKSRLLSPSLDLGTG